MILLLPELSKTIERARQRPIPEERKQVLQELVNYIQEKVNNRKEVHLNFICTHNSRRSQFAQIWAQTAASYFGIHAQCYSGGVEVTEFNPRAVASIERSGFRVVAKGGSNPVYSIYYAQNGQPITAFSKLYDDPANPTSNFAAVMTCSHADENCPFIPGTEKRIALLYDDPKEFDGTPQEAAKYDERSMQIAAELFYVFEQIANT